MLVYRGTLTNIFKRPDRQDKETGEFKEGKFQLEFLEYKKLKDSEDYQTVLQRISIPNTKVRDYREKVGQEVEVTVDYFTKSNQTILYGV